MLSEIHDKTDSKTAQLRIKIKSQLNFIESMSVFENFFFTCIEYSERAQCKC